MSYRSKFVAAVVGLMLAVIVASTQLYLFVRDPQGSLSSLGGKSHFWLAVSAASVACLAGGLLFYFFHYHDKHQWRKVSAAPIEPVLTGIGDNPFSNSLMPVPFNPIRWALANPWLGEGQADDRRPVNGAVADSSGTPSAQRAFARRSHQATFKQWSKERHD